MKRFGIFLLLAVNVLPAVMQCDDFDNYEFYFKVDSGISASIPANI